MDLFLSFFVIYFVSILIIARLIGFVVEHVLINIGKLSLSEIPQRSGYVSFRHRRTRKQFRRDCHRASMAIAFFLPILLIILFFFVL